MIELVLLTTCLFCQSTNQSTIAARINDDIITQSALEAEFKKVYLKGTPLTHDDIRELKRALLRQLVINKLFLHEAEKLKIEIAKEDVDRVIEQEMRNFPTEEAFKEWLRDVLRKTMTEYREEVKEHLLRTEVFRLKSYEWLRGDSTTPPMPDFVPAEEIKRYYEQNKASFSALENITVLRIALMFRNDEERRLKWRVAQSILRRLKAGTEFIILARLYSDLKDIRIKNPYDDPGIIVKDLQRNNELFSKSTTDMLFDQIKDDEMSPVVEDGNFFYIFKVIKKIHRKEEPFEQAQIRIRHMLESENRKENEEKLIESLLEKSYIWPEDLFEK